ncbi:hypothetical protein SECTIM467_172 [Brevibacillus phage SecTim467]|uniref:Uncharacterized protein n=2 Tax=Jenstvirus jenst TaxID=1982225 RepID=A0A0K2CPK3_9CAUD|nr:peptidase [Brevibacillus phage Jenst]ALA07296.1 putative peptidase M20 [Brevibacillus phage Jenst]ALA07494.1 hypothetical protein SECTIM467_172 [Brevibacillus phage SecTim467]
MVSFEQQLFELLCIEAPSGQETKVRKYLEPKLVELVDKIHVDAAGNLLAEKKCGDGNGAIVMLSAHMDSVKNIQKGRKVIEKNGVFFSTKGVLGADDRAGIAIIMSVLRNIDKIDFNGNIKVAFTVSEEIGCVGSRKMDVNWYEDVDLAIVVDRRGNRDIVTGCGAPYNFCSEAVGKFFENCSGLLDMDWKVVGGGTSDAITFSSNGIHSVNLSAGYYNEHTEKEFVVIKDCQDTINLILQVFALANRFYQNFGEITQRYNCAESNGRFFEDELIYQQEGREYGDISLSNICGYISIYQEGDASHSKQDIWMAREDFNGMVNAYLKYNGLPLMEELLRVEGSLVKEKSKSKTRKNINTDIVGELIEL